MDEKRHTAIKKYIGLAFVPHSLQEYEPFVDGTVDLLVQQLHKHVQVDAGIWMEYFTTDTICKIAFDEDAGCLKSGNDPSGFITAAAERIRHWTYWSILPDSDRMIFRNPVITKIFQSTSSMARTAAQKIQKARDDELNSPRLNEPGSVNHRDLIHRFLAASKQNPKVIGDRDVITLAMSILTAGATTTGNTTASVLYHLAKNASALATLEEELAEAHKSLHAPANGIENPSFLGFDQLHKLKYLDATIKETMRLSPVTDHGLWRVSPPGGMQVCGHTVPEGTVMEVLVPAVQRNEDVFGKGDSHFFRPERWIEASAEQRIAMEKCWLAFGVGKRICLGQNIAVLEMKKVLARLIMEFKVYTTLIRPRENSGETF